MAKNEMEKLADKTNKLNENLDKNDNSKDQKDKKNKNKPKKPLITTGESVIKKACKNCSRFGWCSVKSGLCEYCSKK